MAIEWIGSPAFQAGYNEASRLLMVREQKASRYLVAKNGASKAELLPVRLREPS